MAERASFNRRMRPEVRPPVAPGPRCASFHGRNAFSLVFFFLLLLFCASWGELACDACAAATGKLTEEVNGEMSTTGDVEAPGGKSRGITLNFAKTLLLLTHSYPVSAATN